jgi:hypothetical protein
MTLIFFSIGGMGKLAYSQRYSTIAGIIGLRKNNPTTRKSAL